MGFWNSHYTGDNWAPRRYGPSRSSSGFSAWEVWKKLIAINIAVFLLQIFLTRPATEEDLRRSPFFDPEMYAAYDEDFYAEGGDELDSEQEGQSKDVEKDSDGVPGDKTDAEPAGGEKAEADESDASSSKPDKKTGKESPKTRDRISEEARQQMLENMFAYMPRVSIVQEWLELDSEKVKQGQVWRLITTGFCHDRTAIWHLLINMLFLYWFGKRLERIYGSAEFTAFYITALLFASFAYIALDLYTDTNIPAIGASGAVWGVVALYALMYPYERIYVYFLFPIEIRWLVLLYFIFDLHPVLLALSGDKQFTGVAHAAHIGGAIFGFLYWKQGWRLMPVLSRLKPNRSGSRSKPRESNDSPDVVKMSSPAKNRETDRLDEILRKISQQGRESLTDEELEVLEETSRKIRKDRRGET